MAKVIRLETPNGIIKAKELVRKRTVDEDWGNINTTITLRLKKPRNVSTNDMWNAITDQYEARCYCEHDCCAHLNGGADWATFHNKRDITVELSYRLNI